MGCSNHHRVDFPIGGGPTANSPAEEPVLFGAIVPERSEKLIRAEVEGVPFEVVVPSCENLKRKENADDIG